MYPSIYLSISICMYVCIYLSICDILFVSIILSLYLSIFFNLYVCMYVCMYVSIYLSQYLSIYLSHSSSIYFNLSFNIYICCIVICWFMQKCTYIYWIHTNAMINDAGRLLYKYIHLSLYCVFLVLLMLNRSPGVHSAGCWLLYWILSASSLDPQLIRAKRPLRPDVAFPTTSRLQLAATQLARRTQLPTAPATASASAIGTRTQLQRLHDRPLDLQLPLGLELNFNAHTIAH